jgi:hypothetical protein
MHSSTRRVILDPPTTKRREVAAKLVKRSAVNPPTRPQTGTDTVTVACKLPAGLVLRLFTFEDASEPQMGGGFRPVKVAIEIESRRITLKGNALMNPNLGSPYPGNYALTHGVSRHDWETWLSQNQDTDYVKNKIVFAAGSDARATDQAKEQREIKSGLEPIDVSSTESIRARVGRDRLKLSTMPGAGVLGAGLVDRENS